MQKFVGFCRYAFLMLLLFYHSHKRTTPSWILLCTWRIFRLFRLAIFFFFFSSFFPHFPVVSNIKQIARLWCDFCFTTIFAYSLTSESLFANADVHKIRNSPLRWVGKTHNCRLLIGTRGAFITCSLSRTYIHFKNRRKKQRKHFRYGNDWHNKWAEERRRKRKSEGENSDDERAKVLHTKSLATLEQSWAILYFVFLLTKVPFCFHL